MFGLWCDVTLTTLRLVPINVLINNCFHIKRQMFQTIRFKLPFQMEAGNTVTLTKYIHVFLFYLFYFFIKAGFVQFDS